MPKTLKQSVATVKANDSHEPDDDIAEISGLNKNQRVGPDPDKFNG